MAIHITSSTKLYRPRPTSKLALKILIKHELEQQGPDADLNHIDTSKITDMFYLFEGFCVGGFSIGNIKIDKCGGARVPVA